MAIKAGKRPITPAGLARLQGELDKLWKEERPKVVNEVADAAALGDRSENAEYVFGKKRLREIDKRIQYLSNLIEKLDPIDPRTMKAAFIQFGATIELEDEDGKRRVYHLVGEEEVDAKEGRISMVSPIGKALMGKKVGDVASVERPAGELELEIVGIRYGA